MVTYGGMSKQPVTVPVVRIFRGRGSFTPWVMHLLAYFAED